jgi:hypothetical protein
MTLESESNVCDNENADNTQRIIGMNAMNNITTETTISSDIMNSIPEKFVNRHVFPDPNEYGSEVSKRDERIFNILGLDFCKFKDQILSEDDLALERFMQAAISKTPNHKDIVTYTMKDESCVSCVNWKGRNFISGTDIVRLLLARYEYFLQRPPVNIKKFEEGIFSDLRRLSPPHDCVLEATRSDFLEFLFNYDCVRSKKKQKVFFWRSFLKWSNSIFCDAIERELSRGEQAKAVGMNIDDFIKSGIVPSGNSGGIIVESLHNTPYDWTIRDENNNFKRKFTVDIIHTIRNDISATFNRNLRQPLEERSLNIFKYTESVSQERLNKRIASGRVKNNEKQSEPKILKAARVSLSKSDGVPDFSSIRIGKKKKSKSEYRSSSSPSSPYRSKTYKRSSPYSYQDENEVDYYSASTLSSNDDDYRGTSSPNEEYEEFKNSFSSLSYDDFKLGAINPVLSSGFFEQKTFNFTPEYPEINILEDEKIAKSIYEAASILLRISSHKKN